MQIRQCKWSISMIANEEMLVGSADAYASYPDVDGDVM